MTEQTEQDREEYERVLREGRAGWAAKEVEWAKTPRGRWIARNAEKPLPLGVFFSILEGLVDEIKALKNKPVVSYLRGFEKGRLYEPNEAVFHDGKLLIATRQTTEHPSGIESAGWRIAVKLGAD